MAGPGVVWEVHLPAPVLLPSLALRAHAVDTLQTSQQYPTVSERLTISQALCYVPFCVNSFHSHIALWDTLHRYPPFTGRKQEHREVQ